MCVSLHGSFNKGQRHLPRRRAGPRALLVDMSENTCRAHRARCWNADTSPARCTAQLPGQNGLAVPAAGLASTVHVVTIQE